jgi:hypothetical protein
VACAACAVACGHYGRNTLVVVIRTVRWRRA